MSFIDRMEEIYNEKKDLKNPPSYLIHIEDLLKLEGKL